jgi:hypothetical protein
MALPRSSVTTYRPCTGFCRHADEPSTTSARHRPGRSGTPWPRRAANSSAISPPGSDHPVLKAVVPTVRAVDIDRYRGGACSVLAGARSDGTCAPREALCNDGSRGPGCHEERASA